MNHYLARFIACLILSAAVGLLTLAVPNVGRHKIEVRTDGTTADIIAAVESLRRSDVTIKAAPDGFVSNPLGAAILGALMLAVVLWLVAGCVKRLEARLAKPRSTDGPKASLKEQPL